MFWVNDDLRREVDPKLLWMFRDVTVWIDDLTLQEFPSDHRRR